MPDRSRRVLAHGALLLAAGVVTGAVFPAAAEVRIAAGETTGAAAGRLETVDHVGAAVAALTGAVVFVPLLGLTRSAVLLAALLAVALGMVFLARDVAGGRRRRALSSAPSRSAWMARRSSSPRPGAKRADRGRIAVVSK